MEAKVPSRKLDYPGQLQRISRRLRAMPQTARVRIARQQAKRIEALTREAESLKRELRDLIRLHRPELLEETGCGPLTAAILIGQTAGAERFASDAHRALHVIAITRAGSTLRPAPTWARKEAEGKSRMEAMRCLKRHLARRYYRLLSDRSRRRIEHQLYPGLP